MKLALITLSAPGLRVAQVLQEAFGEGDLYVHEDVVSKGQGGRSFQRVAELTPEIFTTYQGLVYIMPCGVVVRALQGCPVHKLKDPAVVVVDVGGRYAISLLSGHEGGANELALRVGNLLSAEPVVTTTTEAAKTLIVGVGCRRGVAADVIRALIGEALQEAGEDISAVRLIASADIKADEAGLLAAAGELGIPLRFISSEEIQETRREFACSELVQDKVGLPAVAEPAALLAGTRTRLVLPRRASDGVTVAIARENCLSLA